MPKYEIEIEGLPEGCVPVAYRRLEPGESYLWEGEVKVWNLSERSFNQWLIVRPRYTPPDWLAEGVKLYRNYNSWVVSHGVNSVYLKTLCDLLGKPYIEPPADGPSEYIVGAQ